MSCADADSQNQTYSGMRKGVVPEVGLEPTCPCERQILSLVRIPISPLRPLGSGHDKAANTRRQIPRLAKIVTQDVLIRLE